jgi:ribose-phosphate pyrophosphokinase
LLAVDALRGAGAARVTLVTPYLPYMRQDRAFHPGEPISQRVVGNLLGGAFDRLITVEPHLHRVNRLEQVVPCPSVAVSVAPLVAGWLKAARASAGRSDPGLVLLGPDAESRQWVAAIAELAGADFRVAEKERRGDARVSVRVPDLPPGTRRVLLVDDVASSGATLAAAAREVQRQGVERVDALVVHALFGAETRERLAEAGIGQVFSTDSIPHPTNTISLAPLVAEALRGEVGVRSRTSAAGPAAAPAAGGDPGPVPEVRG